MRHYECPACQRRLTVEVHLYGGHTMTCGKCGAWIRSESPMTSVGFRALVDLLGEAAADPDRELRGHEHDNVTWRLRSLRVAGRPLPMWLAGEVLRGEQLREAERLRAEIDAEARRVAAGTAPPVHWWPEHIEAKRERLRQLLAAATR